MRLITTATLLSLAGMATAQSGAVIKAPIRSLTRLHGAMKNTISGIGLVTGLDKTGSSDPSTRQAIANLIRQYQMNIDARSVVAGNVAMVSVSAQLPPFSHEGHTIDVLVTTLGDATSLEGGKLELCELKYFDGANSTTYATASGIVSTGGFGAAGKTAKVSRNNPTSGRVTRGATIVRALSAKLLSEAGDLQLNLLNPSLGTARNVAAGINRELQDSGLQAFMHDEALVRVVLPENARSRQDVLRTLTLIRDIQVAVEHPSRVLIHQDTGTIIAGAGVQISPCVLAMSDLTITVITEEEVSQPPPGIRNPGTTERVDRTLVDVTTGEGDLRALEGGGATVGELLVNLRALQLTPRQLIEVFKNLDAGGYLHAPLVMR